LGGKSVQLGPLQIIIENTPLSRPPTQFGEEGKGERFSWFVGDDPIMKIRAKFRVASLKILSGKLKSCKSKLRTRNIFT
jgi:hypothetical protein